MRRVAKKNIRDGRESVPNMASVSPKTLWRPSQRNLFYVSVSTPLGKMRIIWRIDFSPVASTTFCWRVYATLDANDPNVKCISHFLTFYVMSFKKYVLVFMFSNQERIRHTRKLLSS